MLLAFDSLPKMYLGKDLFEFSLHGFFQLWCIDSCVSPNLRWFLASLLFATSIGHCSSNCKFIVAYKCIWQFFPWREAFHTGWAPSISLVFPGLTRSGIARSWQSLGNETLKSSIFALFPWVASRLCQEWELSYFKAVLEMGDARWESGSQNPTNITILTVSQLFILNKGSWGLLPAFG